MDKAKAQIKPAGPSHIVGARRQKNWWLYLICFFLVILYMLPFYVLVNLSFREITDIGSKLMPPVKFVTENYKKVFFPNDMTGKNFGGYVKEFFTSDVMNGFKNSIVIAVLTVGLEIVLGSIAAYGLARTNNRFSNSFRLTNMAVMMIPGTALLVGTYSLMVKLNLVNKLTGLALLSASGGMPGTIFFYTNFVTAIPVALDEAAEIDGAGVIRTFYQIIFPQLKPITITRIIMSFVGSWNSYLMPMYLLTSKPKQTVILVIKLAFSSGNGTGNLPLACATCVIGILPIIVLYLFLQKYIIQGQIDSAVK